MRGIIFDRVYKRNEVSTMELAKKYLCTKVVQAKENSAEDQASLFMACLKPAVLWYVGSELVKSVSR